MTGPLAVTLQAEPFPFAGIGLGEEGDNVDHLTSSKGKEPPLTKKLEVGVN